ncbi:MAG: HAD hydrolase-like protein [Coriobacteriia bacterium]|nr:HAD hydrolase-like protein [Coriobacteriia bacterium]
MRPYVSLVITDLDNTTWDWLAAWYAAFDAMVEVIVSKSGLTRDRIETDMQAVFRHYGTSEYANVIEETQCLLDLHPGENLSEVYAEAVEEKRPVRRQALALYPDVMDTLVAIRERGCRIVAYTESMEYYSMIRMKKLRLDGIIDVLYSPADHELAEGYTRSEGFDRTRQEYTPAGELKPNRQLLLDIIADQGVDCRHVIYVGDKLLKDIKMAQDAGVMDVFAAYGDAHDSAAYECLRRVTHWTSEQVQRERESLSDGAITPSYTLEHSFGELLALFDFGPEPADLRAEGE